jgi:hypothetical protein
MASEAIGVVELIALEHILRDFLVASIQENLEVHGNRLAIDGIGVLFGFRLLGCTAVLRHR